MNPATPTMPSQTHIMSVDVEDYFQVEAFRGQVSRARWQSFPCRVERNMERILALFAETQTTATFFFLGWVARRMPHLVRNVLAQGHEVACHSYWHQPVFTLTPETFRQDTRDAVHAIEDAGGVSPIGYRAPTWSITRKSLWALQVLAEEGFRYDSSIYPVRHDLYGISGAGRTPYAWRHASGFLFELPPATLQLGPLVAPAAGGGYLRIFPLAYTRHALDRAARAGERAVVYFHPWEIDPEQPRIAAPLRSRLRHYTGLTRTYRRLETLLREYRFCSFADSFSSTTVVCRSQAMPGWDAPLEVAG